MMRRQEAAQGLVGRIRGCGLRAAWSLLAIAVLAVSPCLGADDKAGPGQEEPLVIRGVEVGPPVTPFVIDVDLRDLPPPRSWRPGDPIRSVPQRFFIHPGGSALTPVEPAADPLWLLQSEFDSLNMLASEADSFTVPSRNFPGIGYTASDPPDTVGDVGPNHYIQMVNGDPVEWGQATIRIWDKSEPEPNLLASFLTLDLARSWCGYMGGDGVVLYDRQADRWLITHLGKNGVCAYVSRTGDPVTGGWYSYALRVSDAWADYPHPAIWTTDVNGGAGTYMITTNDTDPPVLLLSREAMLAGDRVKTVMVRLPSRPYNIRFEATTPADADGPNGPPTGAPGIIMRVRDTEVHDQLEVPGDILEMWLVDVDWEDPVNTTLTRAADINVADFDVTLCPDYVLGWEGCFAMPGTDTVVMALEEILMHRLQYYRHETYESLIGNFVVDVDGMDHGGVRWFELRRESGGDWSLYQEGTYSLDGDNRWMASIASDRSGNIALGYSVSSSETYPSIRYTGRLREDPLGIMTQPETSMVAGQYSFLGMTRWGDYSAMSLDPTDDCTFWYTNMYVGDDHRWRTQIASFRFDSCGP